MTLRAARLVVAAQGPFDAVLVERLILAFKSDIPRVVSEASTFLADSVAAGGDSSQVLSAFGTHQEHSNNWSRLGALMIRVELVAHRLQDDDVVAWLMEEIDRHRDNSPGFRDRAQYWWPTFQDLLVRAMPALYKNSGADRVVTLLNELETRDLCSHYLLAAIDEWALKISAGSIRESVASVRAKHGREWTEKFRSQGAMSLEEYEEERLEGLYLTLAEACPDENGEPDRGVAFMVALESFGYMARPTTESTVFRKPHLRTVLAPILREWVDALGLSPSAVGSYARLMLKSRPYLIGTVDWPRPPARRPDWNIDRIRQRGLDIAHLVHLLDRSRGNVLLSQLLGPIVLAWRPLEEIDVAISGLASGFNAETWEWVARHASALWGNASKDKAEAMLGKVAGPGTVWLLAVASDAVVARNRDRIREALRSTDVAAERAPRVSDARISAWMLAQLTDEAVLLDAWIALDDWTRRPVVDNPRAMPDSPCDLLAQLILARDATDVVLAKLSQHPSRQVREEVLKSVRQAPFDRDRWNLLLGTSTHAQMIAALRSGSSAQELEWLIAQVDNSDADVRRLVAQALVGSSASQPVTAALQRLQHDPDPAVRDAAFATLAVRQGEEGPAEH
jgi:hypothetical protein